MLPGPTILYKCPNCGNLLSNESLISGNTFGAKLYSDGKQFAPMLPDFPRLSKCKKCDTIFWLDEAAETGSYEWGDPISTEWQHADTAEFLLLPEYFEALTQGLGQRKADESYIRQQIWWAYNDRVRRGQPVFATEKDEASYRANCTRLMALLDPEDTSQYIMIAELKRNLADFNGCLQMMQQLDEAELDWLKTRFVAACQKKQQWVMLLR